MELIRDNWNKNDYKELIDYLFSIRDIKYREFHASLGVDSSIIGIKTPVLKNIAKEISKGNYKEYLSLSNNLYYEEIMIYGFIICNIKDLDESVKYLEIYKNKINNWANCDLFCSSYKIVKKNKEYFYRYINNNIKSNNNWIRRLCFVLLLNNYVEESYLGYIFKLCDEYNNEEYYVNMSIAWLISVCYIKYPSNTIKYIKNNKLNDFTHNKAIQKIRESYRVSREDKILVGKLKR